MKAKLSPLFCLACLFVAGCAVEEVPSIEGTIQCVMENDDTRTSVTDEGRFIWSSGDKVWLHTTSGGIVGTLSSGAGTANAMFSYGAFFGEMTGKAVYPYNSGHSVSGDMLSVVLPSSYDLGSALSNTNAAMYGEMSGSNIMFNHLAGVMRFIFKNVPAGTDSFIITLDKKINGTFEADLTEEYPTINAEETSSDSEKSVTLNFDAVEEVCDISLYVPLPVGTYNTLGLSLKAGDESVWTYSNTVTNAISRKTLKLMPAVTMGGSIGGDIEGGEDTPAEPEAVNLSASGTANSYIVSKAGSYKFTPTKGNSIESVGIVDKPDVLWETFGTSTVPSVGDLVKNVTYSDGYIAFEATDKKGNAVIAAKDASGKILWSWHIWLTDQPEGQVYYNNAGTMMDRNLGATSATPGDVGALGLLYQWGRKDPFLGSSSISSITLAASTLTWPSVVESTSSTGTIDYVTANPTTFVTYNSNNHDWYYSDVKIETDNTRWQSSKTIYDPCPPGWRVPDEGVWSTSLGSSFTDEELYDSTNNGMNFSGKFGSASTIWYPASGYRNVYDGGLNSVGFYGNYWSVTPYSNDAYGLYFYYDGDVNPSLNGSRAYGYAVRCLQESK